MAQGVGRSPERPEVAGLIPGQGVSLGSGWDTDERQPMDVSLPPVRSLSNTYVHARVRTYIHKIFTKRRRNDSISTLPTSHIMTLVGGHEQK